MNKDSTVSAVGDTLAYQAELPTVELGAQLEDTAEEATGIASEKVGLVIVGGLAVGLLAAALLPRSNKKKLAKRSKKISALVGELTQALSSQASDAASEGRDRIGGFSQDVGETVSEKSAKAKKQAGKLASDAADQLNDSGKAIARKLVKLVEKVRG